MNKLLFLGGVILLGLWISTLVLAYDWIAQPVCQRIRTEWWIKAYGATYCYPDPVPTMAALFLGGMLLILTILGVPYVIFEWRNRK